MFVGPGAVPGELAGGEGLTVPLVITVLQEEKISS